MSVEINQGRSEICRRCHLYQCDNVGMNSHELHILDRRSCCTFARVIQFKSLTIPLLPFPGGQGCSGEAVSGG